MIHSTIRILAAVSIIAVPVLAQAPVDAKSAIKAMAQATFPEGSWTGEGWTQMVQGPKEEFTQVETVESKLDGAMILFEGVGHSKGENPKKIHHALGILSFDPEDKTLVFSSNVAGRPRLDIVPEVANNSFQWSFSVPNGGQIRHTILIENGTWHEIGEYSRDSQSWLQFFEMKLTKQ